MRNCKDSSGIHQEAFLSNACRTQVEVSTFLRNFNDSKGAPTELQRNLRLDFPLLGHLLLIALGILDELQSYGAQEQVCRNANEFKDLYGLEARVHWGWSEYLSQSHQVPNVGPRSM